MRSFSYYFKFEIRNIWKNSDIRMVVLLAPFLYGLLLPFIYVNERVTEVPIGFVNQDVSGQSRKIIRMMDGTEEATVKTGYLNIHDANKAIIDDEIYGFLYFPKNFGKKNLRVRATQFYLAVNSTNFSVANPPSIAASGIALSEGRLNLKSNLMNSGIREAKAGALLEPIKISLEPVFNANSKYSYFFVPGLLYAIIQQLIIVGLCFSLAQQAGRGGMLSSQVAPLRERLNFIFGRSAPYCLINWLFTLFFAYVVLPFMGIHPPLSQIGLISLLTFVFTIASALTAVIFGLLAKNEVYALMGLMFYTTPAYLLSGMAWPSYNLTVPMKILGFLVPITHVGPTIRSLMLSEEVHLQHCWMSLARLVIFIGVALAISLLLLRRRSGLLDLNSFYSYQKQ